MKGVRRIEPLFQTEKQISFEKDFLSGWEHYDVWEEIEVGRTYQGANEYVVKQEDLLYYHQTMGETDPLLVDPEYAEAKLLLADRLAIAVAPGKTDSALILAFAGRPKQYIVGD